MRRWEIFNRFLHWFPDAHRIKWTKHFCFDKWRTHTTEKSKLGQPCSLEQGVCVCSLAVSLHKTATIHERTTGRNDRKWRNTAEYSVRDDDEKLPYVPAAREVERQRKKASELLSIASFIISATDPEIIWPSPQQQWQQQHTKNFCLQRSLRAHCITTNNSPSGLSVCETIFYCCMSCFPFAVCTLSFALSQPASFLSISISIHISFVCVPSLVELQFSQSSLLDFPIECGINVKIMSWCCYKRALALLVFIRKRIN